MGSLTFKFGSVKTTADIGWLAGQVIDALTFWWPVTLILGLVACAAVLNDFWKGLLNFDRRLSLLFLPASSAPVVLLVGGVFEDHPQFAFLAYVGFGAGIALAAISGVTLKRPWMSSVSVSLCCLWYSLWCCFVALMSITGDWL